MYLLIPLAIILMFNGKDINYYKILKQKRTENNEKLDKCIKLSYKSHTVTLSTYRGNSVN